MWWNSSGISPLLKCGEILVYQIKFHKFWHPELKVLKFHLYFKICSKQWWNFITCKMWRNSGAISPLVLKFHKFSHPELEEVKFHHYFRRLSKQWWNFTTFFSLFLNVVKFHHINIFLDYFQHPILNMVKFVLS